MYEDGVLRIDSIMGIAKDRKRRCVSGRNGRDSVERIVRAKLDDHLLVIARNFAYRKVVVYPMRCITSTSAYRLFPAL